MADGPERTGGASGTTSAPGTPGVSGAPAERPRGATSAAGPDVDLTRFDNGVGRELVPVSRPADGSSAVDVRRSDVDRWGRSEHFRALTRRAFDPIYKHWFRVEWEGFEHVPATGGALLVANHAGAIPPDAPSIMHGIEKDLGRPVYGLAEHLFRSVPVAGTLWARTGGVTAHPDNAYRLLHDEEHLVLVFPEGTKGTGKLYGDRYHLRRFGRGGFVEIAMRAGVPVVPIAVMGAEESMPMLFKSTRLAKMLSIPYFPVTAQMLALGPIGIVAYLPAKFRIRVLPPVFFDVAPNQERYSRSRVMEESERIRRMVQDALYDMLRKRRSVWFG